MSDPAKVHTLTPAPAPKGVLVYADGHVEWLTEAPMGKVYVKGCGTCTGQMFFDSASEFAEDGNTILDADKHRTLMRGRGGDVFAGKNGGVIVYIQRPRMP